MKLALLSVDSSTHTSVLVDPSLAIPLNVVYFPFVFLSSTTLNTQCFWLPAQQLPHVQLLYVK